MNIISIILFLSITIIPISGQENNQSKKNTTIVFVHGAWGGGWDYKTMESLLENEGYIVYRPTLTGQGEREHLNGPDVNLDTHIMDILNVIKFEELNDIILVGHSYGGMVITGVTDRIPEKIKHIVYVDAMLPEDGESVFSLSSNEQNKMILELANSKGNGYSIPPYWEDFGKDVPHPLETFRQPIKLGNPETENIPATYILTIEPGQETDRFSKYAERAKERNWNYFELPTGHNAQRTMPNEYTKILMDIK